MSEPKATSVAKSPETAKSKTFTNWRAFAQSKLVPVTISCDAYKPVHLADMSCHTKLLIKGESIQKHIGHEHGGGFNFQLKVTEGKPSNFWQELEDMSLEAHDFRCDNCDKILRFHPSSIIPHMKPHGGKTRRVWPGGRFNITISTGRPEQALSEEDEYEE